MAHVVRGRAHVCQKRLGANVASDMLDLRRSSGTSNTSEQYGCDKHRWSLLWILWCERWFLAVARRLLADVWSRPGEDRLKTCLLAASNTVVRARLPWSTTNPSGLVWINLCIKSCGGATTLGAYDSFVQVGDELDLLDSQAVADREGSAESMRILTSSNANSFKRSSGSPVFCDV